MKLKIQRWEEGNYEATMMEDTFHLDSVLPDHDKSFYILYSQYAAYTMWCRAPHLSVRTELDISEVENFRTYLPSISKANPFAMEILAEREEMRGELELYTWMHA